MCRYKWQKNVSGYLRCCFSNSNNFVDFETSEMRSSLVTWCGRLQGCFFSSSCKVIFGAGSWSEAKKLHVGAEWTNEQHGGRKLARSAARWYCSDSTSQQPPATAITWLGQWGQRGGGVCILKCCLTLSGRHRNRKRTQEGVSGWAAEIIACELFNMHHENLPALTNSLLLLPKGNFIWIVWCKSQWPFARVIFFCHIYNLLLEISASYIEK